MVLVVAPWLRRRWPISICLIAQVFVLDGSRVDAQSAPRQGACQLSLGGAPGERVLFLEGVRDGLAPASRPDVVATFFPMESTLAGQFLRIAETVVQEQQVGGTVLVSDEFGAHVLRSAPMAGALERCSVSADRGLLYRFPAGAATGHPTLIRRRALAYLAGVWAGHQAAPDTYGFSGQLDRQAPLVATLLRELGSPRVDVELVTNLIPGGTRIRFTPTAEIRTWLARRW